MPLLKGLFDQLEDLENISVTDVANWLKPIPQIKALENHIANRILYPQTIPVTAEELKINLAILRVVLKNLLEAKKASRFLNSQNHRLIIPSGIIQFLPNLNELVWAFVDGLLSGLDKNNGSNHLWEVVLSGEPDEVIGTLLVPSFGGKQDMLVMGIQGKIYKVKAGNLTIIPCNFENCRVVYKLSQGQLLGAKESAFDLRGGRLGIMIDGRME